jgi:adenylosuccinate synthase
VTQSSTVVLLSGPIGAGKSVLAESLEQRYAAYHLRTSVLLGRLGNGQGSRADLQRVGMSPEFLSGDWLVAAILQRVSTAPEIIVIDSVRTVEQVTACRHKLGISHRVLHVHLTAQPDLLAQRFADRARAEDVGLTWHQAMQSPQEVTVALLEAVADVVVDTTPLTLADVVVRAGAYISPYAKRFPNVDVLVGGQWGSEGKGNIAFALAPEYDLLVRVGAPNAGHKIRKPDGTIYTHRQLPSGTLATDAPVLLGPGAVIDTRVLLKEIGDCGLTPERLTIDARALIIEADDIERETDLKKAIGSTGTGGGAAVARRIMARGGDSAVRTRVPAFSRCDAE